MTGEQGLVKLDDKAAWDIHQRIVAFENPEYSTWLNDCKANRDNFYGAQWEQTEVDRLTERGQYALVINKMRKTINGMVGLLTATQPKINVVPVGQEDSQLATLGVKLNDWVWGNSGGLQNFRKAVKMATRDNISYLNVVKSQDELIKFLVLGYDDVVPDPNSRDPLMRDSRVIYVVRWLPVDQVRALYGIDSLVTEVPTFLTSLLTGQSINLNPNKYFSQDKQYIKVYEGYKKLYIRNEDTTVSVRIQKETLLGYLHAFVETLPPEITEYPIIPVYSEDTENPYKRGEVHFLKGLQKFINKAYGITILNAQLMSNPKVILKENDVPDGDVKKFEDNYAKPGSVSVLSQMAGEIQIIQGQPLNAAFFTLYQDANMQFEQQSLPKDMLGYIDTSQATYNSSRLLDIREAVMDSMKSFAGNIEAAVSQLGKVALQFCRAYLKDTRAIRIVGADKRIERLSLNQRMGLDLNNEQTVQQFIQYQLQQGKTKSDIRLLIMQATQDEEFLSSLYFLLNDVSALDVDVYCQPGSYSPNYEMANLRLAVELYDKGILDAQAVLEHVPMENKAELIERLSVTKQQGDYIESLEQNIEELSGELKRLQRMVQDRDVKSVVEGEKNRQEAYLKDMKAKGHVEKMKQRFETRQIISDTKRAAQELLTEMKNENRNTPAKENNSPNPDQDLIDLFTNIAA